MSDETHSEQDLSTNRWRLADMSASLRSAVDSNTVHTMTSSLLRQLSATSTSNNISLTSADRDRNTAGFVIDMPTASLAPSSSARSLYDSVSSGDTGSEVTRRTDSTASETADISTNNSASSQHMHNTNNNSDQNDNSNANLSDWLNSSLLFAVILFIKLMYDHKWGILLAVAFFITFHFSDKKLQSQVYLSMIRDPGNRQKLSKLFLLGMVCYLSVNIAVTYIAFYDQHLYRSLFLHLPTIETMDFWNLLWVVILTDFIIKFCCIILKAVIALVPRSCVPFNRRGKYYVSVEETMQLYRMVTPIVPWVYFLVTDEHAGLWFSVILVIIYLFAKIYLLWKKSWQVLRAYKQVTVEMVFGTSPSLDDLKACDEVCAICHDSYKDPVKLSCTHIFCEDCVSVWFDREPTCPMCRAKITEHPEWRNGATSAHLQWY